MSGRCDQHPVLGKSELTGHIRGRLLSLLVTHMQSYPAHDHILYPVSAELL